MVYFVYDFRSGADYPLLSVVFITKMFSEFVIVVFWLGFAATAGVRQGCPLSPLLCSVVVDILLRRLCRLYVSSTLRAFADDIGIVVSSYRMLSGLLSLFDEFAKKSGLHLNLPKTVLIHFGPPTSNT